MKKHSGKHSMTFAGFAITLTGSLLFSTKAILVKKAFAASSVDAVALLTLRMACSLPFYLAAAWLSSRREDNVKMTPKQWFSVFLVGIMGYYFSSLFDFIGLQYISAGLERLILFLYPTFAVFINFFFYRQPVLKNQQWALVLTYVGIGLAFFGEVRLDAGNNQLWWGSFWVFLCAVTFSVYLVGSGRIIPKVGAVKFTAYAMLAASLGVFLHFLVKGSFTALQQNDSVWMYGILLALLATVIPSFFMSAGMKRIGSNNVAIISSIGPVSTILQAHFFLGEKIFFEQMTGTALVIAGILLLGWRFNET